MIHSAEEFVRLRSSTIRDEYHRAAHEQASEATWLDVIVRFPHMRVWVAHNKSIPLEILERLMNDPDESVRFMVACKRKLTPAMFLALALDASPSIRAQIARNKSVPEAVLLMLLKDEDSFVRQVASEVSKND